VLIELQNYRFKCHRSKVYASEV